MPENQKFCVECGFKNLSTDKFCGGCGKDLNQKQKKKTDYAVIFFTLSFLFSIGNLVDPSLGFDHSGTDEALGVNFWVSLVYLTYLVTAIRIVVKARKKDTQIAQIQGTSFLKRHATLLSVVLLIIFTTIILFGVAGNTLRTVAENDPSPVFEDALYGTKQSTDTEQVALMKSILDGYKEDSKKLFVSTYTVDTVNILTFESYETLESVNKIISLLTASIAELEKADQLMAQMNENARERIRNSSLSEPDKADMLKGFNESTANSDQQYFGLRRYQTLKQSHTEMLKLYQFLRSKFGTYEIGPDENGQENIFLANDTDVDLYNTYIQDIQTASARFVEADKAALDNGNKLFEAKGLDIKAEDIQNSML